MKTIVSVFATMTPAHLPMCPRDVDRRDRAAGYSKCCFHFVIPRDGETKQYRQDTEASVLDDRDARDAIGICFVGGADAEGGPEDNFTVAQWGSLKELIRVLSQHHQLTSIRSKTPALTDERINETIL